MEKELEKTRADAAKASARHQKEKAKLTDELEEANARATALSKLAGRVGESESIYAVMTLLLVSVVLGIDVSSNLGARANLLALTSVLGAAVSGVLALNFIVWELVGFKGGKTLFRLCGGLQVYTTALLRRTYTVPSSLCLLLLSISAPRLAATSPPGDVGAHLRLHQLCRLVVCRGLLYL